MTIMLQLNINLYTFQSNITIIILREFSYDLDEKKSATHTNNL